VILREREIERGHRERERGREERGNGGYWGREREGDTMSERRRVICKR
jgi:hypothetical protein